MQKAKLLSEKALQIPEKNREAKSRGEKERYIQLNAEFQRIARRDKKVVLSEQCKVQFSSVQFSSVVSDSLRPHGQQHASLPCPSPTLRAYSNSGPSSQ